MNAILGFTDVLLADVDNEDTIAAATTIKRNGEHLLHIINDILDFSKIEAGHLELETIHFNMCECVQESLRPLAIRAGARALELVCSVAPEVPEVLSGDPGRLRQILINLLTNAVRHSPAGEAIDVEVRQKDGELRFDVVDRGVPREVDVQRRDRREPVAHRVEVGALGRVLLGSGRPDPEQLAPAGVDVPDHRLRPVTVAEPRDVHATQ